MTATSIPAGARIGHVHLKVSDLERSIAFYSDLLGFEVQMRYGQEAAFLSAGGYHHHVGLNTWESKNGSAPLSGATGLYHVAFLFPSRSDLAAAVKHLMDNSWPITGASDHGVSEAIYLNDPDGNGIELYSDRPEADWPRDSNGELKMFSAALDLDDLLAEARS